MLHCTHCGEKTAIVRISKIERVIDLCEYCYRIWRRRWDIYDELN